jgi:hypothetical protein
MKTLLILTPVLLLSTLALVMIDQSERDQTSNDQQFSELRSKLYKIERDQRLGPKPYCMVHNIFPRSKKQQDSAIQYISNLTYGELWEVKAFVADTLIKKFIDSVMACKDRKRGSDITTRVPDE